MKHELLAFVNMEGSVFQQVLQHFVSQISSTGFIIFIKLFMVSRGCKA